MPMFHRVLTERNKELCELRAANPKVWTHQKLADKFGISAQRVKQILTHSSTMDRRAAELVDDPRET